MSKASDKAAASDKATLAQDRKDQRDDDKRQDAADDRATAKAASELHDKEGAAQEKIDQRRAEAAQDRVDQQREDDADDRAAAVAAVKDVERRAGIGDSAPKPEPFSEPKAAVAPLEPFSDTTSDLQPNRETLKTKPITKEWIRKEIELASCGLSSLEREEQNP